MSDPRESTVPDHRSPSAPLWSRDAEPTERFDPVAVPDGPEGAAVDLAVDPFDDDLADQLAAMAPRRMTSRTTLALGGLVLVVAGFIGGVLVQRGAAPATPAGAVNGGQGFGGAGLGGANGAGQGGAGTGTGARAAATGTIKLVDGSTIYLTTSTGEIVTVKTSTGTTVRLEQAGSVKELPAGATVTVTGTTDAEGIVTATQVTAQK
jgi:hypothetical protein